MRAYGQIEFARPPVCHLRDRRLTHDSQGGEHVLADGCSNLNPEPNPRQLEPNERVDRIRRIHLNDLENLPFLLVAGFLNVLTEPSLLLARVLLYGYVVSRLLHFAAHASARTHDTRATLWTIGSGILIFMTGRTLLAALGH
jgi:glutathione S-transferase